MAADRMECWSARPSGVAVALRRPRRRQLTAFTRWAAGRAGQPRSGPGRRADTYEAWPRRRIALAVRLAGLLRPATLLGGAHGARCSAGFVPPRRPRE